MKNEKKGEQKQTKTLNEDEEEKGSRQISWTWIIGTDRKNHENGEKKMRQDLEVLDTVGNELHAIVRVELEAKNLQPKRK